MGSLLVRHGLAPDDIEGMLASIEGIFDARRVRTGQAYRVERSDDGRARLFEYEIDPLSFLRLLPASTVGPRLHRRSRSVRRHDDHHHRARRHRRATARRCLRRCRRPVRRRTCRCRWPRCLPARWISTASCSRATISGSSSTSPSATTASSATRRWRRRPCTTADGRWSPSGSPRAAGRPGTTTRTASR